MENASRIHNRDSVREMIKRQTERHGWEFIFLGANIDAAETADSIGIRKERSANYCQSQEGFSNCYEAIESYISMSRKSVPEADIEKEWKRNLEM
jgi:UDP-N-acetyl-D-mannosaminuronic acid transferase (WecB/TagA/CpsF family)